MKPTVSVIIPAYNAEHYLQDAIESVLAQTRAVEEILVIDDGSHDRTRDVAKSFHRNITYFFQDHQGPGAARNVGVQNAKGDFLTFLDADDIWVKDKCKKQFEIFSKVSNLDIVFGRIQQIRQRKKNHRTMKLDQSVAGIIPSAMMVKKKSFFRVGLFRAELRVSDFADWFIRSRDAGLWTLVPDHLVAFRRVHGENTSILRRQFFTEYVDAVQASLNRRRDSNRNALKP